MKKAQEFDTSKITGVRVSGIDTRDWPDMVDAYIYEADYDGMPMTDEELEDLNLDQDFVYQCVLDHLF